MVMHFQTGDLVCDVEVVFVKEVVKCVDAHQWCSAAAVAVELGVPLASVEPLIGSLHEEGFLDAPYHGRLPDSHDGMWLPTEAEEGLLLWHITSRGKALVKAPIGPALIRDDADDLLDAILRRCALIDANPRSSHQIESVTLYGSLCDPDASEFGDVDVVVVANRRSGDRSDEGPRIQLERYLRSNDERADVVVMDESWRHGTAVPEGARVKQVYPR